MRVPRFLVPELPAAGEVALPEPIRRHARRVLRLEAGARVHLFDGRGREMAARLTVDGALLEAPVEPLDAGAPAPIAACSPPRGERLEWLAEKVTELGAAELALVTTHRTPPRSHRVRSERLERIVAEACAQCGRATLPRVTGPEPLDRFLARTDLGPDRYLLDPAGTDRPEGTPAAPVYLAGPEGGLTGAERAAAREAGFRPLALGPLVLRIETALVAALGR